ncbi:plasma membrane ammonium transmembrane transporter Amt3 [Schizosaccharomyces osmophilus]|uniref:Plasma membrane ammonium transmembrane transporter Amt3 n=1 Tax=Schizosaccharomyces osmophilus TaxID=2545709 RepID=A0AAE9WAI1_9SCHI|nr:plasma membrane ammonium transmembrane transporter Amt3 [Schizosaccharomyces osmophilus]WBW72716.1 plasma membrane ammonium transmembrane transporter Amt3 [Schizosaccharomyces osmophilus]
MNPPWNSSTASGSPFLLFRRNANSSMTEANDLMANTYSPADMAYVLLCCVVVFLVTPGIALFYAGMTRKRSALSILTQSFLVTAVILVQWYLFGYSLAVAPGSSFYGSLSLGGLHNVWFDPYIPGSTIPAIVYFPFGGLFAVTTAQLLIGAMAERGRLVPSLVIAFLYITFVYCPQAYWTWSSKGWLFTMGALDFAGGGPVHISSGFAALAYSFVLGRRHEPSFSEDSTNSIDGEFSSQHVVQEDPSSQSWISSTIVPWGSVRWKDSLGRGHIPNFPAHNPTMAYIGVVFIWCSWLTFNSGTLLAINLRTAYIFANTLISSSFACVTWTVVDYIRYRKISVLGVSEGAIAGLVGITPGCGHVYPWGAAVAGIFTAIVCNLLHDIGNWLGIDETLRVFNLHGIGGIMGSIVLGVVAHPNVAASDGATVIKGGWIVHHWKQMGYQFASFTSVAVWSFVVTAVICLLVDMIPGLQIRCTPQEEEQGMDFVDLVEQIDEKAGPSTIRVIQAQEVQESMDTSVTSKKQ